MAIFNHESNSGKNPILANEFSPSLLLIILCFNFLLSKRKYNLVVYEVISSLFVFKVEFKELDIEENSNQCYKMMI